MVGVSSYTVFLEVEFLDERICVILIMKNCRLEMVSQFTHPSTVCLFAHTTLKTKSS